MNTIQNRLKYSYVINQLQTYISVLRHYWRSWKNKKDYEYRPQIKRGDNRK